MEVDASLNPQAKYNDVLDEFVGHKKFEYLSTKAIDDYSQMAQCILQRRHFAFFQYISLSTLRRRIQSMNVKVTLKKQPTKFC